MPRVSAVSDSHELTNSLSLFLVSRRAHTWSKGPPSPMDDSCARTFKCTVYRIPVRRAEHFTSTAHPAGANTRAHSVVEGLGWLRKRKSGALAGLLGKEQSTNSRSWWSAPRAAARALVSKARTVRL